jgi:hypothetical protein
MKVFRHADCLILIGELQALRRRGASLNCVRYARLPLEGATVVAVIANHLQYGSISLTEALPVLIRASARCSFGVDCVNL